MDHSTLTILFTAVIALLLLIVTLLVFLILEVFDLKQYLKSICYQGETLLGCFNGKFSTLIKALTFKNEKNP